MNARSPFALHVSRWFGAIAFAAALLAGCGGGAHNPPLPASQSAPGASVSAQQMNALYPQSQSPASFTVAAMPQTPTLTASVMADAPRGIAPQSAGSLQWTRVPGSAVSLAVAPDGSLWALSTTPAGVNKSIWHYANGTWANIPGSAANIAVAPNGTLYAVNGTTGGVYAYNGSWSSLGGGARWVTAGADGAVYVLSNKNIVNGNSAIWQYASGAWTQLPGSGSQLVGSLDPNNYWLGFGAVAPNGYVAINSSGGIYYYSPGSGYTHLPGSASAIAPVLGGFFALNYPSSASGEGLSRFDCGWAAWTAQSGSGVNVAAGPGSGGTGEQLYVVNSANAIWTSPVHPTVTEYPVLTANGSPHGIVTGPDGALWFTESVAGNIGRITTAGNVTEYPIPTASSAPRGIAAGPDGALWFTETGANKIGRITTAGAVTEYTLPTANSSPTNITAGPDAALWFTEGGANQIGRIAWVAYPNAHFALAEYPIPTANSAPQGIVAGSDGALWFTEYVGGKIGRITTGGTISEYAIPTAYSLPASIAAGSDGALWFTEAGGLYTSAKIGRITTSGSVTEMAASGRFYGDITAGPDGALWFLRMPPNGGFYSINRITTGGLLTTYTLPMYTSAATGIAAGPDGALWFTDGIYTNPANRIGRLPVGT